MLKHSLVIPTNIRKNSSLAEIKNRDEHTLLDGSVLLLHYVYIPYILN